MMITAMVGAVMMVMVLVMMMVVVMVVVMMMMMVIMTMLMTVKVRTSRLLNRGVYVEHLRILDGVAAGATIAEIGEVLHPGAINGPEDKQRDKRIRAAHKAALKMRDEGWRVLAGVPD